MIVDDKLDKNPNNISRHYRFLRCTVCNKVTDVDGIFTSKQVNDFTCIACNHLKQKTAPIVQVIPSVPIKIEGEKDNINNPQHYQGSGLECIQVIEAFQLHFCLGNAIKYILRAGKKGDKIEDLKKAIWYLNREILSLEDTKDSESVLAKRNKSLS